MWYLCKEHGLVDQVEPCCMEAIELECIPSESEKRLVRRNKLVKGYYKRKK